MSFPVETNLNVKRMQKSFVNKLSVIFLTFTKLQTRKVCLLELMKVTPWLAYESNPD